MARIKLTPLDDRIVVEPHGAEDRTSGGIDLPEQAKEKPTRGTCVATGPGRLMDSGQRGAVAVKVGDEVFYGKYAGTEVDVEGKKYTVIKETDVLAIVDRA